MSRTITLRGEHIHDIPSFYDEVNRVFMAGESWQLGHSLDALNDLLYGGFGAIAGNEVVNLVWTDFERCRQVLGPKLTRAFYQAKLASPEVFDAEFVRRKLEALEQGVGQTYFDIVLEIIADHPNIRLIAQ